MLGPGLYNGAMHGESDGSDWPINVIFGPKLGQQPIPRDARACRWMSYGCTGGSEGLY